MLPNALETQKKGLKIIIHMKLLEYEGGMKDGKGESQQTFTNKVAFEVKWFFKKFFFNGKTVK